MPEWPLPFWLKATALNSSEQPVTIVLEADSSYMQEGSDSESEQDPLFHELPLKTLIAWTRWWHSTAKALTLVLKKKVFGVVGSYLRGESGAVGIRIARLRTDWSARG